LKDVPDNLIFHLKRFDFDMVTMLRSKINDQFQFPDLIDMSPYNVEYLSEPDKSIEPDIFELVGVLVHTGTAESGHYYSYTRERPSTENSPSWVEFNDADVSTFDPTNIADQCFGGQTEPMHNLGGVPMNKLWSAYMLFYQRVSSIEKCKQIYKPAKPGVPVRASVPIPLANQITMENEVFIRAYSLLDPLYASLVIHELRLVQDISPNYPDKQTSESLAVSLGLDTFEQLIARNKGHMGVEDIVNNLQCLLRRSPQTASRALWWFCEHPTSIGNLVLKTANADAEIRQRGLLMITAALKLYQKYLSQMDFDDSERKTSQVQFERIVQNIVDLFEELWPNVLTVARAWDDYFDFFSRLAQAGMSHVGVMLDHGILVKCLDVIWLDPNDKVRLRGPYLHYSRLMEKGRRFSYGQLIHLCTTLVASLDLSLPPVCGNEQRVMSATGKYAPDVKEAKILMSTNDEGYLSLLMKLFQTDHFSDLTSTRYIIDAYLHSEPAAGLLNSVVKTLENGLRLSPVEVCIPYLDATLVFCQKSPDEASILGLIDHVAKGVESINNVAGLDHLEFFIFLCKSENERAGLSRAWFNQAVQDRIPDFAPTLLIDTDRRVRNSTFELVNGLLFVDHDDLYDEAKAHRSLIAHELVAACLLRISHSFTESSSLPSVESRQVSAITSAIRCCLDGYYDDSEADLKEMEDANRKILFPLTRFTFSFPLPSPFPDSRFSVCLLTCRQKPSSSWIN
jgi:ubiquitin carboxyl-terminal hydrolase 34